MASKDEAAAAAAEALLLDEAAATARDRGTGGTGEPLGAAALNLEPPTPCRWRKTTAGSRRRMESGRNM
jgi:hypothetical protein